MTNEEESQFHEGEIAVQKKLGIDKAVAEFSKGFIRPAMPLQHREFFVHLPFLALGFLDGEGRVWATAAVGEQGFVTSPDSKTLTVGALPLLSDEIGVDLSEGAKVGMVGIELQTRRRNRMNGIIGGANESNFNIHVEQSFGNCPQYIQVRELQWKTPEALEKTERTVRKSETIFEEAKTQIEKADTFFIASRTAELNDDPRTGIDASHRGGKPGFVRVTEDNILTFPDFVGNRFFNTLGNIEADGRVGLFFPNFETGDIVLITGRAETVWDETRISAFRGAQRLVDVKIEQVVFAKGLLEIEGTLVEASPVLRRTGTWEDAE